MATSPPPASSRSCTPSAPLHGAKFDNHKPYLPGHSVRNDAKDRIDYIVSMSNSTLENTPMLQPTPRELLAGQSSIMSSRRLSPSDSPVSSVRQGFSTIPTLSENGMLPTPAKTPHKHSQGFGALRRVLFADCPASSYHPVSTPRKSRTTMRFTLDDEPVKERIQVFTDPVESMPESDEDADNPFIVRKGGRNLNTSSFTGRLSDVTFGQTKYGMSRDIDEAVNNDQGLVYTFRGRKVFRRFDQASHTIHFNDFSDLEILDDDDGAAACPRLTRCSIKPRLLFPPLSLSRIPNDIDEEVLNELTPQSSPLTTYEDKVDGLAADDICIESFHPATPRKQNVYMPVTPLGMVLKPYPSERASEPATSPTKQQDVAVVQDTRAFHSWQCSKPGAAAGQSRSSKRGSDEMIEDNGGQAKRAKNARGGL